MTWCLFIVMAVCNGHLELYGLPDYNDHGPMALFSLRAIIYTHVYGVYFQPLFKSMVFHCESIPFCNFMFILPSPTNPPCSCAHLLCSCSKKVLVCTQMYCCCTNVLCNSCISESVHSHSNDQIAVQDIMAEANILPRPPGLSHKWCMFMCFTVIRVTVVKLFRLLVLNPWPFVKMEYSPSKYG